MGKLKESLQKQLNTKYQKEAVELIKMVEGIVMKIRFNNKKKYWYKPGKI